MNITNVNRIVGERVVLFNVEMTFGDVIPIGDWAFEFHLCDRYDHSPLFKITLNTNFWILLVEDLHYNHQVVEEITKEDVNSIPNFIRTVKTFVMQIPNVQSYFNLLEAIQNAKKMGVGITKVVNTAPTASFSHLSGSLGQPINPNKKRFLSKATAKMPVTMSVVDDELW
jgi:hypothetical protein